MNSIATIVEGQSEVDSIRVLLERLLYERLQVSGIVIAEPFRVKRQRVVKENNLEKAIDTVLIDRKNVKGILVILDADKDCPSELGQDLFCRADNVTNVAVDVVLPNRNFESWFLAGKSSLSCDQRFPDHIESYDSPECITATKTHLSDNMKDGYSYESTIDQASFIRILDIEETRENSPSFDKMIRATEGLVDVITQ